MTTKSIKDFITYWSNLEGDEKGEAQVFCDRLFQAFGHEGYKEAGAVLEERLKGKKSTKFADLVWPGRVLIEMKKRGAKLESHRAQVFDYWWKLREYSLRDLYKILEEPGSNPVKDAHIKLDKAVLAAYGFDFKKDILTQLLELNHKVSDLESKGESVTSPGLPEYVENPQEFVSEDCVSIKS